MGGLGDRYYGDGDVAYRKHTTHPVVLLHCGRGYIQGCRVWEDRACLQQRIWCEARPPEVRVTVDGPQIPSCALAN